MKNFNTDSSANVSRFARDKRQRINTTERVERSPRPRREADNEGQREYRPRTTSAPTQRRSFNPHFTDENRLRSEYTPREERQERGSRYERTERGDRYERNDRTERSERGGFKPKSEGYRAKSARPATSSKPAFRGEGKPAYKSEGKPAYKSEGKGGAKRSFSSKRDEKPRNYPKYNPNKVTGEVRLNRFISQSGVCSRREADDFILAGVVTVNGQVVTELGTKILPTDEVRFNDERLQGEKNVYLVLNKPKGYVTSLDDPYADKTVMDLVKNACTERVYPVGRLDKNSVGLLLITNDGDITRQLTHPSCHKKKIYQVTLDKPLTRADMDTLTEGITLEDGDIFADEIAYASEDKRSVGVEIHSGRNRIVRRMFEHLGYTVQKLDRVYYAGLTKKNLKRGAWRFLTKEEVMRLKTGQYE
ncbi:MAG: pseudouridine synthase [Rikenellaceae bacterium]|nr:pseudouridine synthase [Rikenellaceae bacterium]